VGLSAKIQKHRGCIGQDFLNTGGLSAKIPKHRGFIEDQPLDCGKNREISGIEKIPINPRYWTRIFFYQLFGPTLMSRGSVGALRLAAERPRDQ